MRTLTQMSTQVYKNQSNPRELGNLYMELGAMYAFYSEKIKGIKVIKPAIWIGIKTSDGDKYLSDKFTEMKWRSTQEGMTEQNYKYELDGINKLMDSIKQAAYLNHQEIKNLS